MLDVSIETQPDCVTCGATCLQAIYNYFDDHIALAQLIEEAPYLETGGTLAVLLGCHALERGYQAALNTFNLDVVDPTWFRRKNDCLLEKLREQLLHVTDKKIFYITEVYIKFLELGGKINFSELSVGLVSHYLDNRIPLLSGVCATYWYQNMRDYTNEDDRAVYDEWLGKPSGHFIVVKGYEPRTQELVIADPYAPHPLSRSHYYQVPFSHWVHAHIMGVMSYDAELLAISRAQ